MSGFSQLRPGFFRWTVPHPAWRPDPVPESPDDWPEEVGCVAYERPGALVLVDPMIPADGGDELWAELDARAAGRDVAVLTTIHFHSRSRDAVLDRYGGSTSAPRGVRTIPIEDAAEEMVWIEEHRALVPGDRLMGDRAGGLRTCPESWLGYLENGMTTERLRRSLSPLLELPVELVLVSHGEPVLEGARAALRAALR